MSEVKKLEIKDIIFYSLIILSFLTFSPFDHITLIFSMIFILIRALPFVPLFFIVNVLTVSVLKTPLINSLALVGILLNISFFKTRKEVFNIIAFIYTVSVMNFSLNDINRFFIFVVLVYYMYKIFKENKKIYLLIVLVIFILINFFSFEKFSIRDLIYAIEENKPEETIVQLYEEEEDIETDERREREKKRIVVQTSEIQEEGVETVKFFYIDLDNIQRLTIFLSIGIFVYFFTWFITLKSHKKISTYIFTAVAVVFVAFLFYSIMTSLGNVDSEIVDMISETISYQKDRFETGYERWEDFEIELVFKEIEDMNTFEKASYKIINKDNLIVITGFFIMLTTIILTFKFIRKKYDKTKKEIKREIETFEEKIEDFSGEKFLIIEEAYIFIREKFLYKYYNLTPFELLRNVDHCVDFEKLSNFFVLKEYGKKDISETQEEIKQIIKNSIDYYKKANSI